MKDPWRIKRKSRREDHAGGSGARTRRGGCPPYDRAPGAAHTDRKFEEAKFEEAKGSVS